MSVAEIKMTISFLERFRPRREARPQAVFDGLAQVRAYWEGLRAGASLPARSALDPRGLSGVLDRVFLAERIGTGLAQISIAGSGLADFAGTDLWGLPLSCLFTPESRPLLAQTLERVFTEPSVAEIDLGSDRGLAGVSMARLLLMPLADDTGRRTLLGAVSLAHGTSGRCKFQILARREERLALPVADKVEGLPDRPTQRFGHLTLVHTTG
jgi:hypothetical protein